VTLILLRLLLLDLVNEKFLDLEATPYEGGEFKIRLSMPDGFPNVAPRGTFLTKIFHPNVGPSGEICVDALKREWNPQNWRLTHILSVNSDITN